jgi:hypothetical protein
MSEATGNQQAGLLAIVSQIFYFGLDLFLAIPAISLQYGVSLRPLEDTFFLGTIHPQDLFALQADWDRPLQADGVFFADLAFVVFAAGAAAAGWVVVGVF